MPRPSSVRTCAPAWIFAAALLVLGAACATAPLPKPRAAGDGLPDPLAAGWRGTPVCERLEESATLRVLRCTFPPGTGHERHFHAAHFGYALAGGRVRITDERGVREAELATGSSFSSTGVAWHEIENIGDTTVVYLIVEPKER
ncbi:MAG: cupin domain-containing protein [Thermoanaerobaculia bacterium]